MKRNSALIGAIALLNSILFGCTEQELTCVDLIKEFSIFPSEFKFQGCETSNESQLRVLRATYQIKGQDSIKVENYLIENYRMTPLKFVCCGWESVTLDGRRYGTYRDRRGYNYHIKMYSGEVQIPEQLKREDIPYFYAEVVGFLEEP